MLELSMSVYVPTGVRTMRLLVPRLPIARDDVGFSLTQKYDCKRCGN